MAERTRKSNSLVQPRVAAVEQDISYSEWRRGLYPPVPPADPRPSGIFGR